MNLDFLDNPDSLVFGVENSTLLAAGAPELPYDATNQKASYSRVFVLAILAVILLYLLVK